MLISAKGISKYFGGAPVLEDVNFEIRPGDHVALVGPNGAGKSTLLKILTDQLPPDAGTFERAPKIEIGYVQQHIAFEKEATVWEEACRAASHLRELVERAQQMAEAVAQQSENENAHELLAKYDQLQTLLEQKEAYQWELKIQRVLLGMGFDEPMQAMKVESLSGGQKNRLVLACVLIGEPDLLILDEPSNHLDIETTEWLEQTLAKYPSAILLVSHDRYFLDSIANRVFELVNGSIDAYSGNYSAYTKQKSERIEVQRRTYEKQQIEIEKHEDFVRRNSYGQKAKQAEDRRKKLARIELAELPREIPVPRFGFPAASRTGDIVLRVEDVSKSFDNKQLFSGLSFQIERGERWAIVGSNGTGKTTLLKGLLGQTEFDSGSFQIGTGVKIGYFDQLVSQLDMSLTPSEAIRVAHKHTEDLERRSLLAKFGLGGDLSLKPLATLSGGERNRTLLALLAALDANFLILDEPTNHLDLWSREALETAIQQFDGTVLLVSHDRYLVNQVADHMLVMHAGRVSQIEGNYDAYQHFLKEGLAVADRTGGWNNKQTKAIPESKSSAASAAKPINQTKPSRKRRFPYRKTELIETDIQTTEKRIEAVHHEMTDPVNLRDGEKVKSLQTELSELQTSLAELYEHYEEALEMN